jgi:hypothetical protein
MAIRQSVLALYGAVSDGLQALRQVPDSDFAEAARLRSMAFDMVGLTGSAGERGWYGELFRYLDDHRTRDERVTPPTLQEVQDDLTSGPALPPTWASQALEAAYVLDRISELRRSPPTETPRLLAAAIAAAPPSGQRFRENTRLGPDESVQLAAQLNDASINTSRDLRNELTKFADVINSAAMVDITARLRKVKREYCSVVTTSAEWRDIAYSKLAAVVDPLNWDDFYHEFFCDMKRLPTDSQGWTRIREEVSGDCLRYRLRTGLKFWKALQSNPNSLFINYDLDPDRTNTDNLVLVDNGYIWITDLGNDGVKVRTSKELLISGMSATAMTVFAATLGWATNVSDMFHKAAVFDRSNGVPFTPSKPGNDPPVKDTSTTWPVIVPRLPSDIRDEMCKDSTEILKDGLDTANDFASDFAQRWEDGIDHADVKHLTERLGDDVTKYANNIFTKATENFRPEKPANKGP